MNKKVHALPNILFIAVAIFLMTIGCSLTSGLQGNNESVQVTQESSTSQSTSQPQQEQATTVPEEPAQSPTATQEPAPSQTPAESGQQSTGSLPEQTCQEQVCIQDGYFLLDRPVGGNGRKTIDHANRFGTYRRSSGDSYHGVFFLNSTGTPVVAAADGQVVVAGDDLSTVYGSFANMYGNLVILKHNLPGISVPVFTLYAQLSEVSVKVDDSVQAGQEIGLVGSSGSVKGSTLYFEVRVGENSYGAAQNPELWLKPLQNEDGQTYGAIAGRIVDGAGNFVSMDNIVLEELAGKGQPALDQIYIKTYREKRLVGLPPYDENFAVSGLNPGNYQVSFWLNGMQQQEVEVQPGKLTYINFQVP
jgi:murein DD-endopeptidase MepM/ murein hydrolase activator NlpD